MKKKPRIPQPPNARNRALSQRVCLTTPSPLPFRLLAPAFGLSFFAFVPAHGEELPHQGGASIPRSIERPKLEERKENQERIEPGSAEDLELPAEVAPIDGYGNNLTNELQGAIEQPFIRLSTAAYSDGDSEPAGSNRASARAISNALCDQSESIPNRRGATDYLWQWGQFLDHDIVETPTITPLEAFNIAVPEDDEWFTPGSEIPLNRSFYEEGHSPREQVNFITAYIDGSMVYGSTEERAYALRALDGSGRLRVTSSNNGDLLPYNFTGLDNAPAPSPNFFLAGDIRANEQVALTAMHTLFMREHNYWADFYLAENPDAIGEQAYQFARLIVAAEIQAITYREFLPILLGPEAIPPYRGYNSDVDATIANEFAAASYRLGHSLLSPELQRLNADGSDAAEGALPLASAFFDPSQIEDYGIESLLRGLAAQECQELDENIVDGLRNFLFGDPSAGGFDLASLNIQRGRDHGLPDYNTMRKAAGLRPARRLSDINPALVAELAEVYSSPNEVDLWIGGLSEPHVREAMVGPLLQRVLSHQFRRLRDGDRFYYESHLPREMALLIEQQTLATIIRRNTEIDSEIQDNVFLIPNDESDTKNSRRNKGPDHQAQ